jgi:hypothetical protein
MSPERSDYGRTVSDRLVEFDPEKIRPILDGIDQLVSRPYVTDTALSRLSLGLAHVDFEAQRLHQLITALASGAVNSDDAYLEWEADVRASLFELISHVADTKTFQDSAIQGMHAYDDL